MERKNETKYNFTKQDRSGCKRNHADADLVYADLQLQSESFRQGICNSGINLIVNRLQ